MAYNYSLEANGYFPQGKITIDLTIINSNNNYDIFYPKLISMDQWEVGVQGENNDQFQYPSGFSLDLLLDGITDDQFINIVLDLQTLETRCFVFQNLEKIYSGYVYISENSVTADFRKKIITLQVVDPFVSLKSINPQTNPFNYDLNAKVSINNLVFDILSQSSVMNIVTEVINLSSLEARCGEDAYYPVSAWGVTYGFYFGANVKYASNLDVLKSILTSLGCKGYIGFDRKFYIVPRIYSSNLQVKTISDDNCSEKIEIDVLRKMQGIQIFLNTGTPGEYRETCCGVVQKTGNDITNPDLVEVMYFDQPVGDIPGGGVSNLFVTDGANWGVADMNHCRRKLFDGTYTPDKSLWRLITDDIWAKIQIDRPLFKYQIYPSNVNGFSSLLSYLTMGDFFNRSLLTSKITHARWLGYNWNDDYIDVECFE